MEIVLGLLNLNASMQPPNCLTKVLNYGPSFPVPHPPISHETKWVLWKALKRGRGRPTIEIHACYSNFLTNHPLFFQSTYLYAKLMPSFFSHIYFSLSNSLEKGGDGPLFKLIHIPISTLHFMGWPTSSSSLTNFPLYNSAEKVRESVAKTS